MDFANRGTRPVTPEAASMQSTGRRGSKMSDSKFIKIITVVLLFSITALAIGLIVMFVFGGNGEANFIKKNKYQAVFLNGGQVYFGKIGKYNSKYLTLSDIYYLRVNQQVQPGSTQTSQNDVSLAKLGSELHGPEDTMVVNRSEVQFWENLKDDGQVVKAITEYKKNPNASTSTNTTPSTTPSTTGNQQQTNTTPTTGTTKKQ